MSRFLSSLKVEQFDTEANEGRGNWRLLESLSYASDILGIIITVPKGFITDFATIPREVPGASTILARGNLAATVHDYLYDITCPLNITRETADSILKEATIAQGCQDWVAELFYEGARIGGESHWRLNG